MSDVEAYVTIHDQDLIADCERSGRFAWLSHTYTFVGSRPIDDVPDDVKMVVARDWSPNYERYPQFYDFTGWWVLAYPGLIHTERIICLQDDMKPIYPNLPERCARILDAGPGPVAFTAGHFSAGNWMLSLAGFEGMFRDGMDAVGVDVSQFPAFEEWPTTQGTAWRTDEFVDFMVWFEPLFKLWGDDVWAGHLAERSMWAWMMSRGLPARILPGVIVHEALDRHGTAALMRGDHVAYQERAATFGR